MKTNFLFFFGCLYSVFTFSQLDSYDHKIELKGIEDQWHKIELPDTVFEHVSQSMNDLRIYGVTENDTLETPYLLQVNASNHSRKTIAFKILNSASKGNTYYFTYEIPTSEAVNQIQLAFENKNFDWKLVLEGSQNQKKWFTILNDYRILSIQNSQTNYSFINLNFPNSKYRYYRLQIKSKTQPKVNSATVSIDQTIASQYRDYTVQKMTSKEEDKSTIIEIDLKQRSPISVLKINISDKVEYYRPFTIQSVIDSVETEKGWRYSYQNLSTGTLNSIENNEFTFSSTLAKKLRLTINNHDNQPLTVETVSAKGYVHELNARFTKPATYYLAYGKTNTRKPQYDISQVDAKIPATLTKLSFGEAQQISKKETPTVSPLIENKVWLWVVMGIVILVLGGFTMKMMIKK